MRRSATGSWVRRAAAVGLSLVMVSLTTSCVGDTACTEVACEHEAVVTFPPGLVQGAYELRLDGSSQTAAARCVDPGNAGDNPEGLTCDANGFSLVGHPLANDREITVTITPDDGDGVVASVRLEAVDEITPNGPDCPPICFVRNGQVRANGGI